MVLDIIKLGGKCLQATDSFTLATFRRWGSI